MKSDITDDVRRDIVYDHIDGEPLHLDLFIPAGEGPFPIVVVLHGGGWSGGDKNGDTASLCHHLQNAGFTAVTPNYRLSPKYRWPACLDDVLTALKWTAEQAPSFNSDTQRIALLGYSAGGQLACMAGCSADRPKLSAVVALAAPTDLVVDTHRRGELSPSLQSLIDVEQTSPEIFEKLAVMSPLNHVRVGLPPFLLVHGTEDKSVFYEQSVVFREKLHAAQVICDLHTIHGAPHRLSEWDQYEPQYIANLIEWMRVIFHPAT